MADDHRQAAYVIVGYCGHCDGAHVGLLDKQQRTVCQVVLNKEEAANLAKELMYYAEHGVRRDGSRLMPSTVTKQ